MISRRISSTRSWDADWLALNRYSNGDILNRFNGDIGTVSGNAISWLPTIIIAIYNFCRDFLCDSPLRLDHGGDRPGQRAVYASHVPGL